MGNNEVIVSSILQNEDDNNSMYEKELMISKLTNEDNWEDEDDDIDEDHVFTALRKLTFLLEIDESMKKKLSQAICHAPHPNKVSQFDYVQEWIEENFGEFLNADEVHNLIKYVELYEPGGDDDDDDDTDNKINIDNEKKDEEEDDDHDYSYLDCPFRCDIPVLAAEIQRQRLSKIVPQYSDTERSVASTPKRCMSPYLFEL